VDGNLALGRAQDFAQARIEIQALGGEVELCDGLGEWIVCGLWSRLFASHGKQILLLYAPATAWWKRHCFLCALGALYLTRKDVIMWTGALLLATDALSADNTCT
jgi:hypothetical protein